MKITEIRLLNRLVNMGYAPGSAIPNPYWLFPDKLTHERDSLEMIWRGLATQYKLPTIRRELDQVYQMTPELYSAFQDALQALKLEQAQP